jgi:chromosome partitioning protein
MKTISFISNKGGTGKTTVAVNIAVKACDHNYRVLIGDLDPQKSSLDWARGRNKESPSVIPVKRGALFTAQFSAEREGIDLLILDTPSASPEISLQAAKASNLTVMVTRPTVMDLRTMTDMVATLKSLGLKSVILLNQAPSQRNSKEPMLVKEAIGYLLGFGLPLVPSCIRTRMAFQASITKGNSASELFPEGVAAHEVNAVWTYLSEQLMLNSSSQNTTGLGSTAPLQRSIIPR